MRNVFKVTDEDLKQCTKWQYDIELTESEIQTASKIIYYSLCSHLPKIYQDAIQSIVNKRRTTKC